MPVILEAGQALLDAEDRPAGIPRCFVVPPSWGSYSRLPDGAPRRFVTFTVRLPRGITHVVDFERGRADVSTSIGIVVKWDRRAMTDLELFACVRSAVRHISGGSRHAAKNVRNQTIWPTAAFYIDVTSDSVRHDPRYGRDVERLIVALLAASDSLLGSA
jgi:hypothetical protein